MVHGSGFRVWSSGLELRATNGYRACSVGGQYFAGAVWVGALVEEHPQRLALVVVRRQVQRRHPILPAPIKKHNRRRRKTAQWPVRLHAGLMLWPVETSRTSQRSAREGGEVDLS
eukprot:2173291-Rhodomonas_salina.3